MENEVIELWEGWIMIMRNLIYLVVEFAMILREIAKFKKEN